MSVPIGPARALTLWLVTLASPAALALSARPAGAAYGAPPIAVACAAWTVPLAEEARTSGFLARLPPTVSVALGLVKAKEGTEVRQLVSKSGHQVRTFNVSVARKSDVILFTVDARTGSTQAYLTGPDARLRKAVSYQAGGEAQEMSAAQARTGFVRESRFWSARSRHASAAAAQ